MFIFHSVVNFSMHNFSMLIFLQKKKNQEILKFICDNRKVLYIIIFCFVSAVVTVPNNSVQRVTAPYPVNASAMPQPMAYGGQPSVPVGVAPSAYQTQAPYPNVPNMSNVYCFLYIIFIFIENHSLFSNLLKHDNCFVYDLIVSSIYNIIS